MVDTQPATILLTGVTALINSLKQTAPVPILVDTQPSTILITGVTAAINAIKQTTIPTITADKAQLDAVVNAAQLGINGLKQTKIPTLTADKSQLDRVVNATQLSINGLKQTKIPKLTADISNVNSQVSKAQSKINSLRGKNVTNTVTTVHKSVFAQHGFTGVVNQPTNFVVGEGGKPEFVQVTPLSEGIKGSNVTNKVTNKIPSSTGIKGSGSSAGGTEKPIVIQNHLHMNEREIASIVSETTANIGNRRQRHFR